MINIRKRNNLYEYRFEVGKVNGKRKQISKSGFKTKRDAYIAGQRAYEEFINGENTKECNMLYSEYLDYWMREYFEINYKYSTAKRYKESFSNIKKELGNYKLSVLTPYILNQALLKLYQTSGTRDALRNYQKVIKSSLRDATYYFGFIKNNPAGDLEIPRVLSFELKKNNIGHIYTKEEMEIILGRFKNNKVFICAFLTACYTGMRTGEVFALTWNDIDLDNRIIKVNKTVYAKDKEENGRWYLGTTKTIGSSREVYICDTLYSVLSDYKNLQVKYKKEYCKKYKRYTLKEIKNKYGKLVEYKVIESQSRNNKIQMVFTGKDGTYSGTDIIRYPFRIIHHELGIQCRFYDLRGNFATICLRNGCEIKDIAEILGHKRIETTQKYYILSLKENKKKVTKVFEENISLNDV